MKIILLEAEFFHAGGQKDRRADRQTEGLTERKERYDKENGRSW
jgi:hypothetical protein